MKKNEVARIIRWSVASLGLFVAVAQTLSGQSQSATRVSWQPTKLVRGSAVLFEVKVPAGVTELSGTWLGHKIRFSSLPGKHAFFSLAGVSVETAPGTYDLELTGTRPWGKFRFAKKIKVGQARYPKVSVRVAKQFTEPSPEQLKEINADKEVKQSVFSKGAEATLWSGNFQPPVSVPVSGAFGTERVFNGQVLSRHLGLDYAAPTGTPVHAVNRGTVILAQTLYFEGGFVVIDHGEGLMSLYLHLSDFKVKQGDEVKTGDLIALSGGSGRATGPHLHLAIRWQGVYLDPSVVLSLKVPR